MLSPGIPFVFSRQQPLPGVPESICTSISPISPVRLFAPFLCSSGILPPHPQAALSSRLGTACSGLYACLPSLSLTPSLSSPLLCSRPPPLCPPIQPFSFRFSPPLQTFIKYCKQPCLGIAFLCGVNRKLWKVRNGERKGEDTWKLQSAEAVARNQLPANSLAPFHTVFQITPFVPASLLRHLCLLRKAWPRPGSPFQRGLRGEPRHPHPWGELLLIWSGACHPQPLIGGRGFPGNVSKGFCSFLRVV